MKNIDILLAEFASASADRRSTIIEELGESSDERIVPLLLRSLLDANEDEIVRVEILKALPFRTDSDSNHERFGAAICNVLNRDDTELVHQFAALALRRFVDVDGVIPFLERIVRDEGREISVRHNALSAIERNASLPVCRLALERLLDVPEFGRSVERTLQRVRSA